MPEHALDASDTRDLTQEGNDIKMLLTSKSAGEKSESKITVSKTSISFTTLAQSAIPNMSASKILLNRITVRYVPDFYYVMDRLQLLFIHAKMDKTLKRVETLNIYSFTLYIAYALMYAYLETVHELNANNPDVADVLDMLRSVGFNSNKLPAIASHWIDALGKYTDPTTKRTFVPYLPQVVSQGSYFDNYFLSADTGHLLPNFRGMFTMISLFADPIAINIPPNNRTSDVLVGGDFPATPGLEGSTQSRRYLHRIPGLRRLKTKVSDVQLPPLLTSTLSRVEWPSDLHRYMMLDTQVLMYLKESISELFLHIDTCMYSNPNPTGTSMTMIPLISDPTIKEIYPSLVRPATPASSNVAAIPGVIINSGFDNAARVKSRIEIINGNIDYVYQTPLVRIIQAAEAVTIDDHVHVSPQDLWYEIEHEFQTPVVTMAEAQAYFNKV